MFGRFSTTSPFGTIRTPASALVQYAGDDWVTLTAGSRRALEASAGLKKGCPRTIGRSVIESCPMLY